MKPTLNFISYSLVAIGIVAGIAGCGGNGDSKELVKAVTLEAELNNGTLIKTLDINGSNTRIRAGETHQLSAIGVDLNGDQGDVSNRVTWRSSDTSIATVNQAGLVTGIANKTTDQGFIEITATTLNGVAKTARVSVNDALTSSIEIKQKAPLGDAVYTCIDTQFETTVTYADGHKNIGASNINWSLSNQHNTTSIDAQGFLHSSHSAAETVTIKAFRYPNEASGELNINIDPSKLRTINIQNQQNQGTPFSLEVGKRLRLKSSASLDSDVSTAVFDISKNSSWQVTNSALVGLTNSGSLKGTMLALKPGSTTIKTECAGKQGEATIQVFGESAFDSIDVTSNKTNLSISRGSSIDLKLEVKYKGKTTVVNLTEFTTWNLVSGGDLVTTQINTKGSNDTTYRLTAKNTTGEVKVSAVYADNTAIVKTITITN